jgi:hypothetical protein
MSKFTDHLWSDLLREHGPTLAQADRPQPGRSSVLRRPRILAGSTLGLAGVGTALVLALGGAAATTPAFAITKSSDGSVLVKLNYTNPQQRSIGQVNDKLAAMGTGKQIAIWMASGPATVSGSVACAPAPGVAGPTVKVLVGANGTEVIGAGQSGGNTAEGSFHLNRCVASSATGSGNTGNTGNTGAG